MSTESDPIKPKSQILELNIIQNILNVYKNKDSLKISINSKSPKQRETKVNKLKMEALTIKRIS